jgi:hypothetical protein
MDFETIEQEIEKLNKIKINANYTNRERYHSLYNTIYEALLELEKEGGIVTEPGKKGLSYLRELLINDGPEFSYTINFWKPGNPANTYKIGVCIRGIPICKPEK